MRRGYVDAGWGQVHYREVPCSEDGAGPALVCLHATAYSGRSLAPLIPHLSGTRRVIAPDTPGYGQSDGPPGPPGPIGFAAIAAALAEAVRGLSPDRPVDLFGYHTGALLATEIAAQSPALVRRLVLVGVPFFEGAERDAWRARLVHRTALGPALEQFAARWDYLVTDRPAGMTLARGFDNFVDELLAYPREWWAHEALFEYDARPRLAALRCPVLVINPQTPLAAASRAAAACIPGAVVQEAPEVPPGPFDTAAPALARRIARFLDASDPLSAG